MKIKHLIITIVITLTTTIALCALTGYLCYRKGLDDGFYSGYYYGNK